jgi:hypothetical protein
MFMTDYEIKREMIPLNLSKIIFNDSLLVTVELNRYSFSLDELESRDSLNLRNKTPQFRVSFKNNSLSSFFFPEKLLGYIYRSYYEEFYPNEKVISSGNDERAFSGLVIIGDGILPSYKFDEYFREMKPGETRRESNFQSFISFFNKEDFLKPDSYWVQIVYYSNIYYDTTLPVWMGKIKSEKVWFHVTE